MFSCYRRQLARLKNMRWVTIVAMWHYVDSHRKCAPTWYIAIYQVMMGCLERIQEWTPAIVSPIPAPSNTESLVPRGYGVGRNEAILDSSEWWSLVEPTYRSRFQNVRNYSCLWIFVWLTTGGCLESLYRSEWLRKLLRQNKVSSYEIWTHDHVNRASYYYTKL